MDKKTKDTMFIDLKYIILYRKLGYDEIRQDVFCYDYADTQIILESEKQRYRYLEKFYPLYEYKDFVILECIDRLLKKGYPSACMKRDFCGYDLTILNKEGELFIGIYAEQWGNDYEKLLSNYTYNTTDTICLYTSQLSGGLVDFKSKIYTVNGVYQQGLFEKKVETYPSVYESLENDLEYTDNFIVKNSELLKYLGNDCEVIIPSGVKRIGAGAFWNNLTLERVILPDTVTCICGDAFVYCENLRKVNIPENVDEMGDDPFAGCLDIQIDNHSPYFINDDGVLLDITGRFLIHYTASKKETKYVIPESVTWIGKHGFYKSQNLKHVHITKNVTFMGNNAFSDCGNIHLSNESPYFQYIRGILYDKNKTTCMHYSMGSGIKEVILEDTVRTIGRNCFWNCNMIEKIVIPKMVRQIGYNPFANCKKVVLENHSPYYTMIEGILYDAGVKEMIFCPPTAVVEGTVVVPNTVINIGRNAFTGCDTMKNVVLPKDLKFISRSSFSGCTNLSEIRIPHNVTELGDWCFNGCTSLKMAYIPKHLDLGPNTFNRCDAKIIRI